MTSSRSSKLAFWTVRVAVPMTALVTLLLSACASSRRAYPFLRATVPNTEFGELGVWQVVCENHWGSALALGGGRFLTCRHVLPAGTGTVKMKGPVESLGVLWRTVDSRQVLRLEDAPERAVTILASGGSR